MIISEIFASTDMRAGLNQHDEFRVALGETSVYLLPERALHLPEFGTLVVADLHFGKVNHFRRAGLPVPPAAMARNAERLIDLLNRVQPTRTIFLGDLFHSAYNDDWEAVGQIVRHYPACAFDLVRGNHDILSDQQYRRQGIRLLQQETVAQILFTHEPLPAGQIPSGMINVAGHIHPAARLVGKGRQSLTMPCFWRSPTQMVLPAFGTFTGLAAVYPGEGDTVYMIVENRILERRPASIDSASS